MKALKRGFEASEENVQVKIQDKIYRCANLKKGGILVQSKVLLANEDIWHEVDVIGLGSGENQKGLENSNLNNFKSCVEKKILTLKHLGLNFEASVPKSYELTHDDFMRLDEKFGFSYIYISKLVDFFKETKQKTGEYNVSDTLKYLKKQGRTIQEYIQHYKDQSKEIINNSTKIIKMEENVTLQSSRIDYLQHLGFSWEENEGSYVARYGTAESPACFMVSIKSIEDDAEEDWNKLVERIEFSVPSASDENAVSSENVNHWEQPKEEIIPETLPAVPVTDETPKQKPVSLELIGNLKPERITEFQSIKESQEKVVADNPFVKPIDAATYKKAKAASSALLKASTAIDGATGIKANKNKFIKQLNGVLDTFLDSMSKMTRTAYDRQNLAVKAWESEEALRIQKEQKEKLTKIKNRTDSLFSVPMVFNGTHYAIGTLYIMPSQIETATDEVFNGLLAQAQGIKAGLDAAAKESESDKETIRILMDRLAKLEGKTVAESSIQPTNTTQSTSAGNTITTEPKSVQTSATASVPVQTPLTSPVIAPAATSSEFVYAMPDPNHKILNDLDLEYSHALEKQPYLKCRSFYVRGTKDVAKEIRDIFASDHPKKSEAIKELLELIEKSE